MTTTTTSGPAAHAPAASSATTTHDTPARSRRLWAWAGVGAGLAGIASIGASMQVDAVYAEDVAGDPAAIVGRLADQTAAILTFHTATMVSLALLVVFAAGLRRRLAGQLPSRSLLPDVAAAGLGLVAVAQLMGSGLTTEFVFGVTQSEDQLVPEAAVVLRPLGRHHPVALVRCRHRRRGRGRRRPAARRHRTLDRLGRRGPRRGHPVAGSLAPAVHGRDDGADLAAAHGARPRAGRPRATCLTSTDNTTHHESGNRAHPPCRTHIVPSAWTVGSLRVRRECPGPPRPSPWPPGASPCSRSCSRSQPVPRSTRPCGSSPSTSPSPASTARSPRSSWRGDGIRCRGSWRSRPLAVAWPPSASRTGRSGTTTPGCRA